MSSNIGKLLLDNKKILLIPSQELNLDVYNATLALANSLNELGKSTSIFIDQGTFQKQESNSSFNFINQKDLNNLVVTLDNINANIQGIKWAERNGKIDILIDTDKKPENDEDISLSLQTQNYDTCILVGFGDPRTLGNFFELHKDFFKADKTIIINKKAANNIFSYKHYPVFTPTISQTMFYFIKEFNLPFTKDVATRILGGLYWGTNSFTESLNQKTFNIASQLVEKGGSTSVAQDLGINQIEFMQAKYFAQVFANLKASGKSIFHSEIEESELNGALKGMLSNDIVPISRISGAEVAFVVVRGKDINTVHIKTNNNDLDLLDLLKEFEPEGTKYNATFTSKSSAYDIKNRLTKLLASSSTDNRKVEKEQDSTLSSIEIKPEPKVSVSREVPDFAEIDHEDILEISNAEKIDRTDNSYKEKKVGEENEFDIYEETLSAEDIEQVEISEVDPEELNVLELEKRTNKQKVSTEDKKDSELKKKEDPIINNKPKEKGSSSTVDPLAPATDIPEPIKLAGKEPIRSTMPSMNSPLPPAGN